MTGRRFRVALGALILIGVSQVTPRTDAQGVPRAVAVEPADLTRRPDLVGREIVVDDRVALFEYHKDRGYHRFYLERCPKVVFELPPNLVPPRKPQTPGARVQGILSREGETWRCDVSAVEYLPSDLDRLKKALAIIPAADSEARAAWSRWAEGRAKAFDDKPLLAKAREAQGEAIRAESEKPRGEPASFWVSLAEKARRQEIPEPEPSAQAHRGFRAGMAKAKTVGDWVALRDKVEAFFPEAKKPLAAPADLGRWAAAYERDPAAAYRAATPAARGALDRQIWADVTERWLDRQAADDPRSSLSVAEEAATLLPERPALAAALLEKGLKGAAADVATLRQQEVENLARLFRDKLGQPDRARELYRAWLNDQCQNRLSPRDAEGRLALAQQYETLLNDPATAVALLRDAWAIDPSSAELAEAFLRRGFRKVNGEWVEGALARGSTGEASAPEAAAPEVAATPNRTDTLRSATAEEVRARMSGNPNRRSWSLSQGQQVEQWVYFGPRENFYINFKRTAGESRPRVVAFYRLPRQGPPPQGTP